jgi:hypothetical protein
MNFKNTFYKQTIFDPLSPKWLVEERLGFRENPLKAKGSMEESALF